MTSPNKSSRWAWAYETVVGTAQIIAVDTVCYTFGNYDKSMTKWNPPTVENQTQPFYYYNQRYPQEIVDLRKNLPAFKTIFNPTTAQWLVWSLGKTTSGAPNTAQAFTTTKEQYSLTIRHEQNEGTTDKLNQGVGCYAVKTYGRAQWNDAFVVEMDWLMRSLEDQDDRANLTTAPLNAGGSVTPAVNTYFGAPAVYYNGGYLAEAVKVEFNIDWDFTQVDTNSDTSQEIYKTTLKPINLVLTGILQQNDVWDNHINRTAVDITVELYKPNTAYYTKLTFDDCKPLRFVETGFREKGYYEVAAVLTAENVTGTFTFEDQANFGTHFLGERA